MNAKFKSILLAASLMVPAVVYAGIADTKHNLGTTSLIGNNQVSDTGEICVFCHTPHAANTGVAAPLWNKAVAPSSTYDTYSSTTIDGTTASVGSVSLVCLSCHDGTQAMDNIINAPGSGGYDVTGGGVTGLSYTWSGPNVEVDGKLSAGVVTNIGTDLQNDHPIGIQYGGGGIDATSPSAATNDPDFIAPESATIAGQLVWWVDTAGGTATQREKTDMILYTRTDFSGSTSAQPSVECASCHSVHDNTYAPFLRISNDGSALCLGCHDK